MTLVGLVADTHDNAPLIAQAAALFRQRAPALVFHLGDIASPASVAPFVGLPVRWVRGNNDVDPGLAGALEEAGFPPLSDEWVGEVEGLKVAATHGHRKNLVHRHLGRVDLLLHGHTHQRRAERVAGTLVVNPGALHRAATRTVALLRLPEARVEWFEVSEAGVAPTGGPQAPQGDGSPPS